MLFKFAAVLISTVLQAAVLAGASSTTLGRDALDIETGGDGGARQTNFIRKLKKEKNKNKDKSDQKKDEDEDEDEDDESEEEVVSAGETSEDAIPGLIPANLRSIALGDDITDWNHGSFADSSGKDGTIKVYAPEGTRVGDTLFLFLSRTDGLLPLRLDGWSRGAECFKASNRQEHCFRASHCTDRQGQYCHNFRRGDEEGNGRDLATVLFYRHVTADDPGCWTFELEGNSRIWAVITAVTNVNEDSPIFRVAGRSCDVEWESVFPSIHGKKNDVLLLSQCFDDTAVIDQFLPPEGTHLLGWTNSEDEAGFLYGKKLDTTGQTGKQVTQGPGGPKCKDALLSVVVNRSE